MSTTINPIDAAELFDAEDGDTAGSWTRIGDAESDPHIRQSRWHNRYWLVVRDSEGLTWGLEYGIGLTEEQENDLPWYEGYGPREPLPLTRLYPHEVTSIEYRETEPTDGVK